MGVVAGVIDPLVCGRVEHVCGWAVTGKVMGWAVLKKAGIRNGDRERRQTFAVVVLELARDE